MDRSRTMTVAEASQRMGVKPETIYAYVSRGLIRSVPSTGGRTSLLDAGEVEALALRGRPRRSSRRAALDIVIETSITSIVGDVVRYRGHSHAELLASHTFEDVAELLWTGTLPSGATWPVNAVASRPANGESSGVDRLIVAAMESSLSDPNRRDRSDIAAVGRRVIDAMVSSLPVLGDGRTPRLRQGDGEPLRGTVAGRLWTRLAPGRPRGTALRCLDTALVLLADHELAASTLAVRVAASTRADPYMAVIAGLSAVSGGLHGAASRHCLRVLRRAAETNSDIALDEASTHLGHLPGFGHHLYANGDPRGVQLLGALREAWPSDKRWVHIDACITSARRRGAEPNIDLALAALCQLAGMDARAGEVIFAIARTAGWLAHAAEEYQENPLRFRPRALFRA